MIVGINASRARSGGAKIHLKNILSNLDVDRFNFKKIHVWADQELLNSLPNYVWLKKHSPNVKRFILNELFWENFILPKKLIKNKCHILFNVDSGSFCQFLPSVSLNQDILCFEKKEIRKLKFSYLLIRQIVLKFIQSRNLIKSDGSIFLTNYAFKLVNKSVKKKINSSIIISHGSKKITDFKKKYSTLKNKKKPIECLYVSPVCSFKHQWNVVRAISQLRKKGFNINLKLIGNLEDDAYKLLINELKLSDPNREFVKVLGHLNHNKLDDFYKSSDIFIFASSCESFGITLLEAMSYGLPIVCSKLSSMPETLGNSGIYFNPLDHVSIMRSLQKLIVDEKLRKHLGSSAKKRSRIYTWKKTTNYTFTYIRDVALKFYKNK